MVNEPLDYRRACDLDDVWEGEMDVFTIDGREVLIVHAPGGEVRAFHPACPHQEHPLIEGDLEGCILTCSAHLWQFDVVSGEGVNPEGVALTAYPVKTENDAVWVALPPERPASNESA